MAEPFRTYILRCADGSYHVGHTDDLDARLGQHRDGTLGGYRARRRPVELVWSADFPTRDEAFDAERRLKGWSRAKKEALIAGDWNLVSQLARRRRVLRDEASTSSASPQDERDNKKSAHPEERLSKPAPAGASKARLEGPVIVLVRPQLGENIGKAARAMLNFGLTELRLVAPRDGWPNPSAGPAAAGADVVLENATVHNTLAEAVADCAHVYATTVRKRGVTKPVVTPEEAALQIAAAQGRSAIVFGPERSGLETDDVALARAILTVPINPEFGSLNLAQAVILCAYEWSKTQWGGGMLAQPTGEDLLPPAPQEELEGLIGQLEAMLEPRGYFLPESRAAATRRTLRTMLTKPGWNHLEVRTMRGVLSSLAKPPRDPA
ncbi:TrmH family RNA methyltransferase [Pelagerythrobacter rhizovicinus]|uniref:rRNA methyltransferase n=1 Tax=Pelagerythrobacter rhizovicinus TaxID=2268576 RepID=A0A4Q2KPE1_9SPHN|nr:TrmH family RNA methyltransferase [Pelagerythrobacter rhizovicinus]RXZ66220.1 rRNA methyltransferase [Pelagerythrobacter rhizovicinus]